MISLEILTTRGVKVTAVTAVTAAVGGVDDRKSDEISGSRVGCEGGSELPDETDFTDAGHDDMADYIETGDTTPQ